MWKAAFSGRSEKGGDAASAAGRSEPRRKKSGRSERGDRDDDTKSVISSTSRRNDDREGRKTGRSGIHHDGESTHGASTLFSPASSSYATAPTSRAAAGETRPLTESALRMLPDDEDDGWEDEEKDARSDRRSERRKKRGSGSSDERERRRKSNGKEKERKRSSSREKKDIKKKSTNPSEKKNKASRRSEPELVSESSRAIPAQGSFEQFPGQYAGGSMGGHPDYTMSGALPSAVPNSQFPGQEVAPYSQPPPHIGFSRADSYGAAADYYLDEGQSVHHQPGARVKSPNMLVNPDTHLVSASAVANPAQDTGNGSAADFYSGAISFSQSTTPAKPGKPGKQYSASAHTTPAKPTRPGKQSSYSDSKPKPSKPSQTSSASAVAAGLGTAAGISALGKMSGGRTSTSHYHSQSEQQTSSSYQQSVYSEYPPTIQSASGQVSQDPSDGNVFYTSPLAMNGAPSAADGVPQGSLYGQGNVSGKQSTQSSAGLYAAGAGAAAAGLAAYGVSHHGRTDSYMPNAGAFGGGGQGPPSNYGGVGGGYYRQDGSSAGGSMMQQGHFHEHKGPMTKLKDGLLNLISTPEDVAKMEMYTEYIGVCKHCFDPRTSAWDAPRVHHYHGKSARRQDSFESLRRRLSNEKLRRKGSHERVDKDSRYYASESSRRRREERHGSGIGLPGAGLAATGAATVAGMIFNDRENFDDTYSVKSGHRESSAIRRRSRSSSREQRRKSQYGTIRPDRDEYVIVRRSDGTTERRRRSRSGDRKSGIGFGTAAAAGAALGTTGMAARSRRRLRSSSREKLRRSDRSEYSPKRRPTEQGGIFGFFSPSSKQRRDSRGHGKKGKGFFTFSNGSSSSSNSELAFGGSFVSRNGSNTSLNSGVRRKSSTKSNRGRQRRKSDEHLAATLAGIGTTAAALAAAQRGGRITKRQSRPELGAKRRVQQHVHGSPGSSDEDWEDELPSDVDDNSSVDGGLAFGDYDGKRLSSRQSLESVASQYSAGGLGAWGWRWGGKDKKGRKTRRSASGGSQYPPTTHDSFTGSTTLAAAGANATPLDTSRPTDRPVYLDDSGRPLPSFDGRSSTSSSQPPLQFVDPAPIAETPSTPGSRHQSMPGAFDVVDAAIYRPASGQIQQPQPYSPARPAFTQPGADKSYTITAEPQGRPDIPRRTQSSPVQSSWAGDAAAIGMGALGAGAILAGSALSSGRKSRDQGRVSFGLTEEQERKQDRETRKEAERNADEQRRRSDRTRALKEEAERSAKEARQEEVRHAREEENRRTAQLRLDQQREQERKEAEEARARAEQRAREERERKWEIERLDKEAKDRQEAAAAATAEFERQRQAREEAERQQAEYERLRKEREDAYQREQYRLAEEAQRQDAEQRQWDAERYAREYQLANDGGRARSNSQKQSSASSTWAPIAGATAAATIGAAVVSSGRDKRRKSDDREESPPSRRAPRTSAEWDARDDGVEIRNGFAAKEVTPPQTRDGAPIVQDDIFDPDLFKRKQYSGTESPRHEELARKAAAKVVADREKAYSPERHAKDSYADFFASEVKDIISKQPGEKQRSMNPDSDVQVRHIEVDDVYAPFPRDRAMMVGRSKHAPYGVPSLNIISPTPPPGSSPTRDAKTSRASSPLAKPADAGHEREESPDSKDGGKSERSRSISWGQDKTHVYDVQTPESYQERDSYITSPDLKNAGFTAAAAIAGATVVGTALHDVVGEVGDKKTTNGEEDFSTSSSKNKSKKGKKKSKKSKSAAEVEVEVEDVSSLPQSQPQQPFYHQPYFDSVSDFSGIRLDSPGTEGAPPVRGFVEGETNEPTLAEERKQHIPGGFDDDDANDVYRPRRDESEPTTAGASREPEVEEPAWEPPLSKKDKKKREKAAKKDSLADSEPSTPVKQPTPVVEQTEPAGEPPLSRKEQKKRDKAVKRMSLGDSEPTTPAEPESTPAEPENSANEDVEFFSTLSKKDKKKREKAAKKAGFVDVVSEMSTPSWTGDTVVSGDTVIPLSRQESPRDVMNEQRKSEDREAGIKTKSTLPGLSFADVTDTILASGGIAAAAAALNDSPSDESLSGSSKKDKKKKKKSKLGEPSYDDPRDNLASPEEAIRSEPSGMPGGWNSPERKSSIDEGKQDDAKDPFKYELRDEPPSKQETDPWSEWSEPVSAKKSKKKSKRGSAAYDSMPQVSSPLRSEVAWDDYVGSSAQPNREQKEESEAAHSDPITVIQRKSSKDDDKSRNLPDEKFRKSSNDDDEKRSRRQIDFFDAERQVSESPTRTSPDETRSVASASSSDRKSRREEARRNSDYFDQPDYAYETQSVAASEPVDHAEGRKKHKRRSKHEDDDDVSVSSSRRRSRHADDDDNMSVVSSRSRREKDESPSVRKEKKGIFSSMFSRKSYDGTSSKDGASLSKSSSRDDEDEERRRRKKKSSRESEHGDDDDTRSVKSSSHSSRRHRSEDSRDGEIKERRRHSTKDDDDDLRSESSSKHHRRRNTDEDIDDSKSERRHRRQRTDEDADQSFLGSRVEELPPLPVSRPGSPDTAVERMEGRPLEVESAPGLVSDDISKRGDAARSAVEGTPAGSLTTSPESARTIQRQASSTAVPLRFPFGHAPTTPSGKERASSFSFPLAAGSSGSATVSPVTPSSVKTRQGRPHSSDFKSGFMPLYLVERNRQTPEVEDTLPSLPSSKPSSRSSSVHGSDEYQSAVEEIDYVTPRHGRSRSLTLDTVGANDLWKRDEHYLNSQETTPKASEFPPTAIPWAMTPTSAERKLKQEPQFYTWEDFARDERLHEQDYDGQASTSEKGFAKDESTRSKSPSKRSDFKTVAAATMLGTAAVYAGHKLAERSPELETKRKMDEPAPSMASHSHPLPTPLQENVFKGVEDVSKPAVLSKKSKKKVKETSKGLDRVDAGQTAIPVEPETNEQEQVVRRSDTAQEDVARNAGALFAANVPPHESPYEEKRSEPFKSNDYYSSAAAHTLPVYGVHGLVDTTPESKVGAISEEEDRPTTAYKLPETKSEPAPLVIDERTVQVGEKAEEIAPAPRLTRKQSQKASKKGKRDCTILDEDTVAGAAADENDQIDNDADRSLSHLATEAVKVESASVAESQNSPQTTPSINFGLSDFGAVAADAATAWGLSQANAFHESMKKSRSRESILDANAISETPELPSEPAEIQDVEAAGDEWALPSSKKKGKKGKKAKQSALASALDDVETEVDATASVGTGVEQPHGPLEATVSPELQDPPLPSEREAETLAEMSISAPEAESLDEWTTSSSKKKGKKGQKSKLTVWDEPVTEKSESVAAQAGPAGEVFAAYETTDPQPHQERALDEPAPALREPEDGATAVPTPGSDAINELFPVVSKKKNRKDKKKSNASFWEDDQSETPPLELTASEAVVLEGETPLDSTKTVAEEVGGIDAPSLEADTEDFAPVSSKKKSKKDKKKANSLLWVEDESEKGLRATSAEPTTHADEIPREEPAKFPIEEAQQIETVDFRPDADDFAEVPPKKKSKKDKKKAKAISWDDEQERADTSVVDRDQADAGREIIFEPPGIQSHAAAADERSIQAAEDDFFGPVSTKKNKKDRKKAKAAAWDDLGYTEAAEPAIEALRPEDEDFDASSDAKMQKLPATETHGQPEDVQKSSGASLQQKSEKQSGPAEDDFAAVPSKKKSKKDKKKSSAFSFDAEPYQPLESPPELGEYATVKRAEGTDIPQQTQQEANDLAVEARPEAGETPVDDEWAMPSSSKKLKNDKKKKKKVISWDAEPDTSVEPQPSQVEEPALAGREIVDVPKSSTFDDQSAAEDKSAPTESGLTRKQSKKDKKKKKQQSLWDSEAEPSEKPKELERQATTEPQDKVEEAAQPEQVDITREVPPPNTPDEPFHDAEDFNEPTTTEIWHDVEETTQDAQPATETRAIKKSWADEMDDLDATQQPISATADQSDPVDDVFGIASGSGEPDTALSDSGERQEFMADRGMDFEPERATEDMDAFGDPSPRDPSEWSLGSKKKSSKKGKKARKSISTAAPVVATAAAAVGGAAWAGRDDHSRKDRQRDPSVEGKAEEPLALRNEHIDVPGDERAQDIVGKAVQPFESEPEHAQQAESEPMALGAQDEAPRPQQPDEFSWAALPEGKKGKRTLIDEPEGSLQQSQQADLPVSDAAEPDTVTEEKLSEPRDVTSEPRPTTQPEVEFHNSTPEQPVEPVDEFSWAQPTKNKKGKKAKTSSELTAETLVHEKQDTALLASEETAAPVDIHSPNQDTGLDSTAFSENALDEEANQDLTPTVQAKAEEFSWVSLSKKDKKKAKKAKKSGISTPAVEEANTLDSNDASQHRIGAEPIEQVNAASDPTAVEAAELAFGDALDSAAQPSVGIEGQEEFAWVPTSKKDKKKAKKSKKSSTSTLASEEPRPIEAEIEPVAATSESALAARLESEVIQEADAYTKTAADHHIDQSEQPQESADVDEPEDLASNSISKKDKKKAKKGRHSDFDEEIASLELPSALEGRLDHTADPELVDNNARDVAEAAQAADDFVWSSSSNKKGRNSKNDRRSLDASADSVESAPISVSATNEKSEQVANELSQFQLEPSPAGYLDGMAGEPVEPVPQDTEAVSQDVAGAKPDDEASRKASDGGIFALTKRMPSATDAPAYEPQEIWSMLASKKKKKNGEKSKGSGASTPFEDELSPEAIATSEQQHADGNSAADFELENVRQPISIQPNEPADENADDFLGFDAKKKKKKKKKERNNGNKVIVATGASEAETQDPGKALNDGELAALEAPAGETTEVSPADADDIWSMPASGKKKGKKGKKAALNAAWPDTQENVAIHDDQALESTLVAAEDPIDVDIKVGTVQPNIVDVQAQDHETGALDTVTQVVEGRPMVADEQPEAPNDKVWTATTSKKKSKNGKKSKQQATADYWSSTPQLDSPSIDGAEKVDVDEPHVQEAGNQERGDNKLVSTKSESARELENSAVATELPSATVSRPVAPADDELWEAPVKGKKGKKSKQIPLEDFESVVPASEEAVVQTDQTGIEAGDGSLSINNASVVSPWSQPEDDQSAPVIAAELGQDFGGQEASPGDSTPEQTTGIHPVDEEGESGYSVKKSKKDKKKARKSSASAADARDDVSQSLAVEDENGGSGLETLSALAGGATTAAVISAVTKNGQSIAEPTEDHGGAFSCKTSKIEKKRAKKSGTSTPAQDIEDAFASNDQQDDTTHSTSIVEEHIVTDQHEDTIAASQPGDKIHQAAEVDTSGVQRVPSRESRPGSDVDFTATVAAGLADSGFNPDMVINDPVFQRRASPTGVAEADPEEVFSTTTSKKRKGKKAKKAAEFEESEASDLAIGSAPSTQETNRDDLNDIVNQTLQGTGFDPALLEKAISDENDEPDVSFITTKRKKSKKGKQTQASQANDIPDSTYHASTEPTKDAPEGATLPHEIPNSIATTAGVPLEPTSTVESNDNGWMVQDEMDVDAMDKAYRAYKKNKRQQKKVKAAAKAAGLSDAAESTMDDTERSAAVSDAETRSIPKNDEAAATLQPSSPRSVVSSVFPNLERAKRRTSSGRDTVKEKRLSSGSQLQGLFHTSEVSQHLPTEKPRSPEPLGHEHDQESGVRKGHGSNGLSGVAAGMAALGAGALAALAYDEHHGAKVPTSQAPEWSFATLENDRPRSGSFGEQEHDVVRDSGYDSAAKRASQQTDRSSRDIRVSDIVRPSSSRESLRERRSLEPLRVATPDSPHWNLHAPKQRPADGHQRTPSASTPLDPTSKNRASYLFQSPPDNLAEATLTSATSAQAASQSFGGDYFNTRSTALGSDRSPCTEHVDRAAFSPTSPRAHLDAIPEEKGRKQHARKRSKAQTEVGGPDHIKAIRRTETPQEIRVQELALSPTPRLASSGNYRSISNPTSTSDEVYNRLSWPAVDEDNDTVNLDRALPRLLPRAGKTPGPRSPSVVSNISNTSGNQYRSPQELRSYSRTSNRSETPSLRRTSLSGDLRAASRRGEGSSVSGARSSPKTIPFEAPPTPPPNDDDLIHGSASGGVDMNGDDVFQGYGDAQRSQVSPTRPPSVRKRQSMHINDLESRMNQLIAENRALQEAKLASDGLDRSIDGQSIQEALEARDVQLQAKDVEINQIKAMLQPLQEEVARLSEINGELTEANRNLVDDTNGRYATLQAERQEAQNSWQSTQRELESMRQEHGRITSGMRDIVESEIANSLADKNAEILRLREQLDIAAEQIRALQVQIQSSKSSDFLQQRDEDYFDGSCQKLCQHVQQWVLRFSKTSDNRICRLSTDLNDDKLEARLDNAVLDGSDVDKLLGDRVRRRDVFMSVVMTMVWEYIFTRYLFGMDREQRQKLKALEKLLADVGPARAVAHWRATTLTLLSRRPQFEEQCAMDTVAVAHEIFGVLCLLLPPPASAKEQLQVSLQKVLRIAVDLAIEMRTQCAEYIMLPPLQPEYDTNGDLVRKVYFNASLMNERSGFFSSNEELAAKHAVVKIVLFPLVVKKGDDFGEGDDEIVVCPAQVLVQGKRQEGDKKVVRVISGAMEIDDPIRSRLSRNSLISEAPGSSPGF